MVCFPPCKINLGLNILSRRPDGYHSIETCFYPVPWTDILEIIPAQEFAFSSSGLVTTENPGDNLCVKAYRLLKKDFPLGAVQIHLHKIIPSGAGLGGGSSDAASTLILLNSIFELSLAPDDLEKYAAWLGSDCAFFIENRPLLGSGRGEELQEVEVDLKNKFLVLVKPSVGVSTAEAYAHVVPKVSSPPLHEILKGDRSTWREALTNDFEEWVFQKFPEIASLKETLYRSGAEYASMSGSGSAVFGIFDQKVDLRSKFSGMTYWAGNL